MGQKYHTSIFEFNFLSYFLHDDLKQLFFSCKMLCGKNFVAFDVFIIFRFLLITPLSKVLAGFVLSKCQPILSLTEKSLFIKKILVYLIDGSCRSLFLRVIFLATNLKFLLQDAVVFCISNYLI